VLGVQKDEVERNLRLWISRPSPRRRHGLRHVPADAVVDLDGREATQRSVRTNLGVADEGGVKPALQVPQIPGTQ